MNYIKTAQSQIRDIIKQDLNQFTDPKIREVTEYALNSGKRLRPMLIFSLSETAPTDRVAQHFALFIEYVHNSSLIIDDLPCMDNDLERRGSPTVHAKYGQHIAQLVAFNLMIIGMKHLSDGLSLLRERYSPEIYHRLVDQINNEVSHNLGMDGVCGGQLLDLTDQPNQHESDRKLKERILKIISLKTGTLFAISFMLGWILFDSDSRRIESAKQLGFSFGMCYQIIDDLRDIESDTAKNGAINNICRFYTRNELIDMFGFHMAQLEIHFSRTPLMSALLNYLISSFKKYLPPIAQTGLP